MTFPSTLVRLLIIVASVALLSMPARAQQTALPEDVTRGFYSWYLHQLSLENATPLKQKTTALKYLTSQLYANAPRLIRRMDADIFICAQDWDKAGRRISPSARPRSKTAALPPP